jgi:hypothetical protein
MTTEVIVDLKKHKALLINKELKIFYREEALQVLLTDILPEA